MVSFAQKPFKLMQGGKKRKGYEEPIVMLMNFNLFCQKQCQLPVLLSISGIRYYLWQHPFFVQCTSFRAQQLTVGKAPCQSMFNKSMFYKSTFYKSMFYKSMFYKSTFYKSIFYKSMFYKSTFYKSIFHKSTFYKSMFYKSSPCFTNPIQSMFYNMPMKRDNWVILCNEQTQVGSNSPMLRENQIS